MRSFLAALRTLVLPYGKTLGRRLILDGVLGRILAYTDSVLPSIPDPLVVRIDSDGVQVIDPYNTLVKLRMSQGELRFSDLFGIYPNFEAGARMWMGAQGTGVKGQNILMLGSSMPDPVYSNEMRVAIVSASPDGTQTPGVRVNTSNGDLTEFLLDGTIFRWNSVDGKETWSNATLMNSWTNQGAPYSPAGYLLRPDGFTALRGIINPGNRMDGTVLFQLPPEMAPAARQHLTVSTNMGGVTPGLQIDTAGNVMMYRVGMLVTAVGLDGIQFASKIV